MELTAISSPEKPELPPEWNVSQDVCALQYRHSSTQQTCLVKAIPMGDTLLLSAVVRVLYLSVKVQVSEFFFFLKVATKTDKLISLTITPSKYVKESPLYTSLK